MPRKKKKSPSKAKKLQWNLEAHRRDAYKDGFRQAPSRAISQAQKMQGYEAEAKKRGISLTQVIAESMTD